MQQGQVSQASATFPGVIFEKQDAFFKHFNQKLNQAAEGLSYEDAVEHVTDGVFEFLKSLGPYEPHFTIGKISI